MIKVALITSDRRRCGIREHSEMLMEAVRRYQPDQVTFTYCGDWLDPAAFPAEQTADLVHFDYHRGLHSRWTPAEIASRIAKPVVITFHDTYERQPDRLLHDLVGVSNAVVIHEPIEEWDRTTDGRVRYWRQAVWPPNPSGYTPRRRARPYVGTAGFNFPWKNFDLIAAAAKQAGWGVCIVSHDATDADEAHWHGLNPWAEVHRVFGDREGVIAVLMGCDATAWMYSCANSGTSGAIRLGIAAGKPVIATRTCRQFRDLRACDERTDPFQRTGIYWTEATRESLGQTFRLMDLGGFSAPIVRLREQDSWEHRAADYVKLYEEVLRG